MPMIGWVAHGSQYAVCVDAVCECRHEHCMCADTSDGFAFYEGKADMARGLGSADEGQECKHALCHEGREKEQKEKNEGRMKGGRTSAIRQ